MGHACQPKRFRECLPFFPTNSSSITFYQTNDPNGASVTREVASGQRIGSSDIYVGVLENPVPVGYAFYEFATETINNQTDFGNTVYHDKNAFMVGRSPFNSFFNNKDFAVGRNEIDHWSNSVNVDGTIAEAIMTERDGEGQDVLYEATLVVGDSGAPLLFDLNEDDINDTDKSLRIVGTNWFLGAVGDPSVNVNGFSYLGNHDEQIQAFIDLHAVPEPSTALLLAFAGTTLIARRRRG